MMRKWRERNIHSFFQKIFFWSNRSTYNRSAHAHTQLQRDIATKYHSTGHYATLKRKTSQIHVSSISQTAKNEKHRFFNSNWHFLFLDARRCWTSASTCTTQPPRPAWDWLGRVSALMLFDVAKIFVAQLFRYRYTCTEWKGHLPEYCTKLSLAPNGRPQGNFHQTTQHCCMLGYHLWRRDQPDPRGAPLDCWDQTR